MTKKYEKFEEWMIGKKISVGSCEGVVLGRYFPSVVPSEVVCIKFKTGDRPTDWMWAELADVTFLEEVAPKEESSPIPWEVGQVVWDIVFGKGVVNHVEEDDTFPVKVALDDGGNESYTLQGSFIEAGTRTLFFSKPTIIADTMPPKKPFVPTLMKGDKVLAVNREDSTVSMFEVYEETEDAVSRNRMICCPKVKFKFFKLGEEIKWEN